jgi:ATP-binding cassette, subfamily B, bacterial
MISFPRTGSVWREMASMKTVISRAVHLVFTPAPGLTCINIVLIIIQGLLPLAALLVMKMIIDTVTSGIGSTDNTAIISQLIFLLGLAAGIALLIALCKAISRYTTEMQALLLTDMVTDQIQAHSLELDLSFYENPAYQDSLHQAQIEGPSRPTRIVNEIIQVAQDSISVCAIGGFIIMFSPFVGVVLVGAALPAALVRVWYSQKLYELRIRQTEPERKSRYYHRMMTDTTHAQEVRLFDLGPLFRERYRMLQGEVRNARLAISRSVAIWEMLTQGIITAAIFGSYAVIALMTIQGIISLGDMVVFFMGFQLCIGYTQSIFSSINELYADQLFMRNLFSFLDMEPQVRIPKHPVPVPSPFKQEIRFDNVTFIYPGAISPALSHIDLVLHKGEVIALVGNNGSGKSTFTKLLCRLYETTEGTISVDGIDLKQTEIKDWQRNITILFQDYVRYHLSVLENIWIGDTRTPQDTPRLRVAAQQAAAEGVIKKLPENYSSLLGKEYFGGHELSTGEWQKIALARAFFRDAEIVILDEPASSLDALAEVEVFSRFRKLVTGRTAILVSHRFSTVLLADHIYVFSNGRIIEQGNHSELMAHEGHYAKMFLAQAGPYRHYPSNTEQ